MSETHARRIRIGETGDHPALIALSRVQASLARLGVRTIVEEQNGVGLFHVYCLTCLGPREWRLCFHLIPTFHRLRTPVLTVTDHMRPRGLSHHPAAGAQSTRKRVPQFQVHRDFPFARAVDETLSSIVGLAA